MKIISAKDYQALSRAAANIISAQVIPQAQLCPGPGHRLQSGGHLSAAHRVVQEG